MTDYFPNALNVYPAVVPYVPQIPLKMRQGDSERWIDTPYVDLNGVQYDSGSYSLRYTIAGPIPAAIVITSTPNGANWQLDLTTLVSATLAAGTYSWAAQIIAAGFQRTIGEGTLIVKPDLSQVGANYDGRTNAEKALSSIEAMLATGGASNGYVKSYHIGDREMTFQNLEELRQIRIDLKAQVQSERIQREGGASRFIRLRMNRAN